MEINEILKQLCEVHAPSGREHWIFSDLKRIFEPYGNITTGGLNNLYIHKKGEGKGSITIMAHSDEVSLIVTEITQNGFLKFKTVGIDAKTLVSQEVIIHGKQKVLGIIGIKPPHLMSELEKKKPISADELFIDTGYSKDKLKEMVSVGDFVTLRRNFKKLLNNNVTGKALDDRAGIAAMLCCAEELNSIKHQHDIYFVCTCQEEVGHYGAKTGTFKINPTIGIAIDVTFDGGTLGDSERETYLGGGPVIAIGPNIHPKLRKKLTQIAKEYNIPYQIEINEASTGTDAWDIQVTRQGIPTLLVSIPLKYMHSSVEIVNIQDIKNTGRLIARLIEKLGDENMEELLCF